MAPGSSSPHAVDQSVVVEVDRRLRIYGSPTHHNRTAPLDELVFIVLSAQTEEYLYLRTFEALAGAFPGWHGLADAPLEEIEAPIRAGGLYRKKARQLKAALTRIVEDAGCPSLDFLQRYDDQTAYDYLVSLPGISRKSALCVMLYSLRRAVFPVDTHVWRVARRLGWTLPRPKPSGRLELDLERAIPAELRRPLHVNMVAHGRAVCMTYNPRCNRCPLADLCPSFQQADVTWSDWRQPGGVWARGVRRPSPSRKGRGGR